jgi:hypothetical protein
MLTFVKGACAMKKVASFLAVIAVAISVLYSLTNHRLHRRM